MERELRARIIGAGILLSVATLWVPGLFASQALPLSPAGIEGTPCARIEFNAAQASLEYKGELPWSMG